MSGFPVSDEAIRALRLKVLRSLVATSHPEHALGAIAGNNDLTIDDAKALVSAYGFPDHKEMRRYIFELDRPGSPSPAPSAPRVQPCPAIPHPSPDDRTGGLLQDAEQSTKHRTLRLARQIRRLVAELADLVKAETKERQLAEAVERRRTELAAEVADLEAQLAAKKAALKPIAGKASTPKRSDSKAIREWAMKHSIDCPKVGRVPADVVEAYDLAAKGAV